MELNPSKSTKNKRMFSFKKLKSKEFTPHDGDSSGYSSTGTVSASSTFSYKGSAKKKMKKNKKQLTQETLLNFDGSSEDIKSNDDEKNVTDGDSTPESERKNPFDQADLKKTGHYKSVDKALEIPLISDGYSWISGFTAPYLDRARSVSTPVLDTLTPYLVTGKMRLDQYEPSRAAVETLIDVADKVDNVAADCLHYLLDNYPVLLKPSTSIFEQLMVIYKTFKHNIQFFLVTDNSKISLQQGIEVYSLVVNKIYL